MKSTWDLIICDKDLNVRVGVGEHNEPKVINHSVLKFKTKKELMVKYEELINEYIDKSYDWKCHSEGAMKFYYEKDGMDILTYLLVYHNGEEVMSGLFSK